VFWPCEKAGKAKLITSPSMAAIERFFICFSQGVFEIDSSFANRCGISLSIGKSNTIVDFPAQATDFLLGAFQHFRLLDSFEVSGVRPTLLIFAADDSTAAESASASARFFLDKADYILVENPAKFQSEEFKKTALFKWLSDRKTPTIRLPAVTEVTINEWKALERRTKKYIQLEEAIKHPDLFYTVRDELTYFRDTFLAQFEDCAVPRIISDAALIKNKVVRGEALKTLAAAAALEDPWL
jgi:hypothetical protein